MPWHARLQLDYHRDPTISADAGAAAPRTLARYLHNGPLRILQSLYPEGDAVCHNVLVHPPGGLVGGDTLEIQVSAATGTHGLVTTPGATRFYRSDGALALQDTQIHLAAGARLEWLPLETLCYSGCQAENRLQATLDAEFAFVAQCNVGGEFLSPDKQARLREIGMRRWQRTLDDRLGLSRDELARKPANDGPLPIEETLLADKPEHRIERPESERIPADNRWGFRMDVPELLYNRGELHNLSISRGTLTAEDTPGGGLTMVLSLRSIHGRQPVTESPETASTPAPATRLRVDLELLPRLGDDGVCEAAKDISMAGVVGTAMMLLECSQVGAVIDVDAIPRPNGVPLQRWLAAFPSYGFVLSVRPEHLGEVLTRFAVRDIACSVVGDVTATREVHLRHAGGQANQPHRA
mgnify:CR=1 FL=1